MLRRLAIAALLLSAACEEQPAPPPPPEPPVPTTGSIRGTLTPFRAQSTEDSASRSALLRQVGVERLSRTLSESLAARRGVQSASLASPQPVAEDTLPGDVIVRFEEGRLSDKAVLARVRLPGYRTVHKAYITEHLHLIGYEPLERRALSREEAGALVRTVGKLAGVRYAEKNARARSFAVPNDPLYPRQWHYPAMNLPAAWDITTGSASVVVAVLDTGIVRHPDLDARVLPGMDMVTDPTSAGDGDGRDSNPTDMGKDEPNGRSSWHGAHVAGTIGAQTNDGRGVAGVTWSGRNILPVRVLGRGGGSLGDIAAGLQWAIGEPVPGLPLNPTPAKVINMSLGGPSAPNAALQEVINTAVRKGAIIVVAAGNDDMAASQFIPCNQQDVICVGATRFDGRRADYSNYGNPTVDVMGAGGQTSEDLNGDRYPDGVYSTLLDSLDRPGYEYHNGTSMAAPHVAGIVALMAAVKPDLTHAQAQQLLMETADTSSRCAEGCGAGLVNAQAAVLAAKSGGGDPTAPPRLGVGGTQLSFTGGGTQQLAVRNLGGGTLEVGVTAKGAQASALSFSSRSLSIPAYGSASLAVTVSAAGLANGDYLAQVGLAATNGNTTDVLVKLRVGTVQDKDAAIGFFYLDSAGVWQLEEAGVALARAASGYNYSVTVPPRSYYALGFIDDNGDGELQPGERLGLWRDTTNIEPIALEAGRTVTNVSFALVPYEAEQEQPSSKVGQPCTSDAQCDVGGLCGTNWPGGYCTQDCRSTACPVGSVCYSFDGSEAFCLATCTGVGTQGSCRTSYVCVDNGAASGVCAPP